MQHLLTHLSTHLPIRRVQQLSHVHSQSHPDIDAKHISRHAIHGQNIAAGGAACHILKVLMHQESK